MQFQLSIIFTIAAVFATSEPKPVSDACQFSTSSAPDNFIIIYNENITQEKNTTLVNEIECHKGKVNDVYKLDGYKGLAVTMPQDLSKEFTTSSQFKDFIDVIEKDGKVQISS